MTLHCTCCRPVAGGLFAIDRLVQQYIQRVGLVTGLLTDRLNKAVAQLSLTGTRHKGVIQQGVNRGEAGRRAQQHAQIKEAAGGHHAITPQRVRGGLKQFNNTFYLGDIFRIGAVIGLTALVDGVHQQIIGRRGIGQQHRRQTTADHHPRQSFRLHAQVMTADKTTKALSQQIPPGSAKLLGAQLFQIPHDIVCPKLTDIGQLIFGIGQRLAQFRADTVTATCTALIHQHHSEMIQHKVQPGDAVGIFRRFKTGAALQKHTYRCVGVTGDFTGKKVDLLAFRLAVIQWNTKINIPDGKKIRHGMSLLSVV